MKRAISADSGTASILRTSLLEEESQNLQKANMNNVESS